jgi:hypothetical protein
VNAAFPIFAHGKTRLHPINHGIDEFLVRADVTAREIFVIPKTGGSILIYDSKYLRLKGIRHFPQDEDTSKVLSGFFFNYSDTFPYIGTRLGYFRKGDTYFTLLGGDNPMTDFATQTYKNSFNFMDFKAKDPIDESYLELYGQERLPNLHKYRMINDETIISFFYLEHTNIWIVTSQNIYQCNLTTLAYPYYGDVFLGFGSTYCSRKKELTGGITFTWAKSFDTALLAIDSNNLLSIYDMTCPGALMPGCFIAA